MNFERALNSICFIVPKRVTSSQRHSKPIVRLIVSSFTLSITFHIPINKCLRQFFNVRIFSLSLYRFVLKCISRNLNGIFGKEKAMLVCMALFSRLMSTRKEQNTIASDKVLIRCVGEVESFKTLRGEKIAPKVKVDPFTVELKTNFLHPKLPHHPRADIVFDSILKFNFHRILFIYV